MPPAPPPPALVAAKIRTFWVLLDKSIARADSAVLKLQLRPVAQLLVVPAPQQGAVIRTSRSCGTAAGGFGDTAKLFIAGIGALTGAEAAAGGSCARNKVETTTVPVAPAASRMPATVTTVIFAFDHAMIFNAPFTRVKVEALTAAPFASATAVIDFRQHHRRGLGGIGRNRARNCRR